jgi:hypothetical protein
MRLTRSALCLLAATVLSPGASHAQSHPLRESDVTTALGYTPAPLGSDGTLSATTIKPTGSSTVHTLADTAAAAFNSLPSATLNGATLVTSPYGGPATLAFN